MVISSPRALRALARGRVNAAVIQQDTVTMRRPGGTEGPFDPDLGYAPVVPHAPYYTGKGKITPQVVRTAGEQAAGQIVTALRFIASVPLSVIEVRPEDIVTCTASLDPANVGKQLRVTGVHSSTFMTARRMLCVDYQENP